MARKPKQRSEVPVYVAGEEKYTMFGWCLTGHHDGCVVGFPGHKCSCKCHGGRIDTVGEVQDE